MLLSTSLRDAAAIPALSPLVCSSVMVEATPLDTRVAFDAPVAFPGGEVLPGLFHLGACLLREDHLGVSDSTSSLANSRLESGGRTTAGENGDGGEVETRNGCCCCGS